MKVQMHIRFLFLIVSFLASLFALLPEADLSVTAFTKETPAWVHIEHSQELRLANYSSYLQVDQEAATASPEFEQYGIVCHDLALAQEQQESLFITQIFPLLTDKIISTLRSDTVPLFA